MVLKATRGLGRHATDSDEPPSSASGPQHTSDDSVAASVTADGAAAAPSR